MKKDIIVLLAGGYGTRLGEYPKQYIKHKDGKFLFEHILDALSIPDVFIITNQAYHIWWWTYINSNKKYVYNLLVEPHYKADEAFGPLKYLLSEIPKFCYFYENIYVSPIDEYFSSYKALYKLRSAPTNTLVVARYPEQQMKNVGVCLVENNRVTQFWEKQEVKKQGWWIFDKRWVFTGVFKTNMDTIQKLANVSGKNLGDFVTNAMLHNIQFHALKYRGLYRDVGTIEIVNTLVEQKRILPLENVKTEKPLNTMYSQ